VLQAQLDALGIERRRLEVMGLDDTPEYREIAAGWDRARMAHYEARRRAGDDSDTFKAEMVYVGHTDMTMEDLIDLEEQRELSRKWQREVFGEDYEGLDDLPDGSHPARYRIPLR